jgi:hypothetical protein
MEMQIQREINHPSDLDREAEFFCTVVDSYHR